MSSAWRSALPCAPFGGSGGAQAQHDHSHVCDPHASQHRKEMLARSGRSEYRGRPGRRAVPGQVHSERCVAARGGPLRRKTKVHLFAGGLCGYGAGGVCTINAGTGHAPMNAGYNSSWGSNERSFSSAPLDVGELNENVSRCTAASLCISSSIQRPTSNVQLLTSNLSLLHAHLTLAPDLVRRNRFSPRPSPRDGAAARRTRRRRSRWARHRRPGSA